MTTFVEAVENQESRTENGMMAQKSTSNALVDLFYNIGASRGKNIVPQFVSAYSQNSDVSLRIAQWARDIRGGAGERQLFKQILEYLERSDPEMAEKLLRKIPEIGRWDDIFVFKTQRLKNAAYTMLGDALRAKNGLAAKWAPRQGPIAVELRKFFGMSPKFYRKSLVEMTNVVEQQMCAKKWDEINFSHVPSLAHARYKKAFGRNTKKYAEYIQSLVKGEDGVKVNAGAVYPHDVLKGVLSNEKLKSEYTADERALIAKQWEALENFIGDSNVLPLIDVSGSMMAYVGGSKTVSCLDVSVSLGLYCADKNKGKFNGTFLTFSGNPSLVHLNGDIVQKCEQIVTSDWGMNTDLIKALNLILKTAVDGNVPQSEMPSTLLIFSDMQFDQCVDFDDSAMLSIERAFKNAGYEVPQVVFWNLRATGNVPVKAHKSGVALVSGFSPSVLKAVLGAEKNDFTPEAIMMKTVMVPRYDL